MLRTTSRIAKRLFSTRNNQGFEGIKVDQEAIKRKIEKMKEREKPNKMEFSEDLMPIRKGQKIPQQQMKFRTETNSQGLFSFKDVTLQPKPTQLQVTTVEKGQIFIDKFEYPGSLIVFTFQVFCWEVEKAQDIRQHHFQILDIIDPKPDFIVIGVQDPKIIRQQIIQNLTEKHKQVEIMPLVTSLLISV